MKKPIIIANWKMQLSLEEAQHLTKEIAGQYKKSKKDLSRIKMVLCPSFTSLEGVGRILEKHSLFAAKNKTSSEEKSEEKGICLGAQNLFWEEKGAFTGEVSPRELRELGVSYVIVGHSERRENFQESDEMIHKKIKTALEQNFVPILCVGETFEQRQQGKKDYVIIKQVDAALRGIHLKANQKIVIAYEPIWVIGSGQAVEPEEAEYVNRVIYQQVLDFFPLPVVRQNVWFTYGGSVNSAKIKQFIDQETIDGVLVGGASLDADEFIKMSDIIAS